MYETLIPQIKTILESVAAVKAVYPYPLDGAPKLYPAVVFFPDTFDNSFDTTADNAKVYRFKLYVVVNLSGTNEEQVFSSVLPNVVDKVIAAFDEAWDGGSQDGHRIWQIISSGVWGMSQEQKGKEAFAELTLTVRMDTTV